MAVAEAETNCKPSEWTSTFLTSTILTSSKHIENICSWRNIPQFITHKKFTQMKKKSLT